MKSIEERTWCGDFEIVCEGGRAYEFLLFQFNKISEPVLLLESIKETWYTREQELEGIRIQYIYKGKKFAIWTQRIGDFFNDSILPFLNRQLNLNDYKFEYSWKEESVYFINAEEKRELEKAGVYFREKNSDIYPGLLLFNIIMELQYFPDELEYGLIQLLNDTIEEHFPGHPGEKQIKSRVKDEVLGRINWEKAAAAGLQIENLYAFVNSN